MYEMRMGYHQLLRSLCNRVAAFNRRMRENRTYGGVGGCRGAIPGTRPDQRFGARWSAVALHRLWGIADQERIFFTTFPATSVSR